jgi:chloramphenicol 3-O phosphotransferase
MKLFKYIFIFLLVFVGFNELLFANQTANATQNMPCTLMKTKYQIIYINGPSSSGKTTLAQLLQQELDPPFLHIGIDRVIGMMPDKLNDWEGGPAPLGFSWKNSTDETGHPAHEIQLGPFAKKMSDTLKEIVITLARLGHYIIIDDVAFGKEDVDKWKSALKDYNVLWIGIHTPLPILEQREKQRGNRMIGSARAQYYQVHKGAVYDLEFDTSKDSLEKIVHDIKEKLCPKTNNSNRTPYSSSMV